MPTTTLEKENKQTTAELDVAEKKFILTVSFFPFVNFHLSPFIMNNFKEVFSPSELFLEESKNANRVVHKKVFILSAVATCKTKEKKKFWHKKGNIASMTGKHF